MRLQWQVNLATPPAAMWMMHSGPSTSPEVDLSLFRVREIGEWREATEADRLSERTEK